MSETKGDYVTNCPHLSTSTDELEQLRQRVKTAQDEITFYRENWYECGRTLGKEIEENDRLRQRVAEQLVDVDAELASVVEHNKILQGGNHRLAQRVKELEDTKGILQMRPSWKDHFKMAGEFGDALRWAKAWKDKAKHTRKGWKNRAVHAWWIRRRYVEKRPLFIPGERPRRQRARKHPLADNGKKR